MSHPQSPTQMPVQKQAMYSATQPTTATMATNTSNQSASGVEFADSPAKELIYELSYAIAYFISGAIIGASCVVFLLAHH